ncbi:MAG: histidinol-phosphate transaminase, partial [archaeon]|nr:histidinol-phosphate transaminase [archaeon]
MIAFILAPKNSGLEKYSKTAFSLLKNADPKKTVKARGEDIPFLLKQYFEKGKKAVGITGEDLYSEFCLKEAGGKVGILEKVEWKDPKAFFGKPVLCLLGPKNKKLEELPKNLVVYISSKYKKIAENYLLGFERKGFEVKKVFVNGCVEASFSEGLADLAIDIVYSGRSMEENGLCVYGKIFESNLVILGKVRIPEPKKSIQNISKYDKCENRIDKMRLDFNENLSGCSTKVLDSLKKISPETISCYPEYGKFMEKLAEYLGLESSEILLTNGSDEGIKLVIEAFVENGEEAIILSPAFSMFEIYSNAAGARIKKILYREDFVFPLEEILGSITEKTKIIVLVNPNSPTGTMVESFALEKILVKAKGAVVLVDEAYCQYSGKSMGSKIRFYDNLVVLQSFSKCFGLAGLRLGYVLANPEIIGILEKIAPPYNVNSLAVVAGIAALDDTGFVKGYVREVGETRQFLSTELERLGVKFFPSKANFVLAKFGEKTGFVWQRLFDENILVKKIGEETLRGGFLRITIGPKKEMEKLVSELKNILREKTLLFDLDGVLVDVSDSYRLAIIKTAEYFTGKKIGKGIVQKIKERGGFNNDWDVTEQIIMEAGIRVEKSKIIDKFQEFYLKGGLIDNEKLIIEKTVLKSLFERFRLGIVTGRPKNEALYVLEKFGVKGFFECIVCLEDVSAGRPNPAGIILALQKMGGNDPVFVGDSVDD